MKIFELFSGIGAPRKALEKAGIEYESLGWSEIDKYASASYEAIYNDSNNFGDITKIDKLPNGIDLLFHGSPCQDFSVAGKGLGATEGTRSNLMFETVRLVTDALPKVVIWENVKGVLSKKHLPAFEQYLNKMSGLGYTNHYEVLNAKHYGMPQNRERIFVVSVLNNDSEFIFPSKIELEKCMGDYMDDSFGVENIMFDPNDKKKFRTFTWVNGQNGADYKALPLEKFDQNGRIHTDISPTIPTVTSANPKVIDKIEAAEKGDGVDLSYLNSTTRRGRIQKQKSQTITTTPNLGVVDNMTVARVDNMNYDVSSRINDKHGIQPCQKISDNNTTRVIDKIEIVGRVDNMNYDYASKILSKENSANCSTASMGLGGGYEIKVIDNVKTSEKIVKFGKGEWLPIPEKIAHLENGEYLVIRKLKPIECWRLMGFEDADFENASSVCSNSQLYKQAGNSIVTNVLTHLFKELKRQGIL
jgi:DNA (cytosine-5)-methyltransferase 1